MQGVEGQIFGPMARTYAYALVGALIATFTVTPCLTSLLMAEQVSEVETVVVRWLRSAYTPVLRWSLGNRGKTVAIGLIFLAVCSLIGSRLGSRPDLRIRFRRRCNGCRRLQCRLRLSGGFYFRARRRCRCCCGRPKTRRGQSRWWRSESCLRCGR